MIFYFCVCEEKLYYLFMIHRLYISWIVSLYLVLVTDLLLYLYGQLKLKAMHGIVQFEVYLTCADLRMKGRRQNLAEELNKIKVIIPQSFVASIMSSPNPSLSLSAGCRHTWMVVVHFPITFGISTALSCIAGSRKCRE